MSNTIRILLIDKNVLVRSGFKLLLESRPGLEVCGEAGDETEAVRLAEKEQPDIVLLHETPVNGATWLDLIPKLMAVIVRPRIILVTPLNDPQYHVRAVKNGVMGIVMAQLPPEILFKAIEKIHAGEVWLDRSLIANFLTQESNPTVPSKHNPQGRKIALLSARERQIIGLVGEGLKNQQIADQLFLSEVTVRHHLTSIFKKLGVADRLELVIYAYQNSLAKLPD